MAEPHIVVIGQWRRGHARLPLPYAAAVKAAGGHPKIYSAFELVPGEPTPRDLDVVTGLDPDDDSALDGAAGLVVPGGGDIDPALYGQKRHPETKNVSHRRDRFELTLLKKALEKDVPVLAICHGMQLLNVALGGTLEQHLPDVPNRLNHDLGFPEATPAHSIAVKEKTLLADIAGGHCDVNSSHHQGLDVVADPLEEVAWAEDGVLEAVASTEHPWAVGVQWHPEAMAPEDPKQLGLFAAFVEATRRFRQNRLARSA